MKITLIDKEERSTISGIAIYNKRLYEFLTTRGHQVEILRFSKNKFKDAHIHQIPYYLDEEGIYIFIPSEKSLPLIKSHLMQFRPDIVYTSIGISPLDFFLPNLCRELTIPLTGVIHMDFNHSSAYQMLMKSIFMTYLSFCKELDLLHVFSSKFKDFWIRKGVAKEKILILPNGVDPTFYKPGPSHFQKKHHIQIGIMFMGRLMLQKNPEVLLKTFLELDPPIGTKLIVVGGGELEKSLRQKYADPRIIFTGLVTDEKKKRDIIRACHLFVLPSLFEGMSLALLETMSCQLACITTDAGSGVEMLGGNTGIIIPVDQITKELPRQLTRLITNKRLIISLGKRARKRVIGKYDQDRNFAQLVKTFTKTIRLYRASVSLYK